MRRLLFVLAAMAAVLFVGSPTMDANAQMSRGMATVKTVTQNHTPIEKAACFGWGHCRPGFHQVCGPRRCFCVRC